MPADHTVILRKKRKWADFFAYGLSFATSFASEVK